jgi:hypothetical protein
VVKAILVARYLRGRARWRLDSAGAPALQTARSVVALLDAASYLRDVPDSDPDIVALEEAGWFQGGAFEPSQAGVNIVRGWQLAEKATAGPRDLLSALAHAARGYAPPLVPSQATESPTERIPRLRRHQASDMTRTG